MKDIVVGIDFSRSSLRAFQYAVGLAAKTGSNLQLIYVNKKRDYPPELEISELGNNLSIEKCFKMLIDKHQHEIKGKMHFKVHYGKIFEEITNQAKYSGASLIVTGAHGLSGFEELWVGNNAYKIVSHASCPVITVRESYNTNRSIEKIILPIDSTLETIQKIPFTLELAQAFKAQVYVLSLLSARIHTIVEKVEMSTREAINQISQAGLRYFHHELVSENIPKDTIDYALKKDADLISIMSEQEFAPRNVFLGTSAQQLINQSPIPVLSHKTQQWLREDRMIE